MHWGRKESRGWVPSFHYRAVCSPSCALAHLLSVSPSLSLSLSLPPSLSLSLSLSLCSNKARVVCLN
jgi:hypothetical protein